MDLNIRLEDERLCTGCPMNDNGRQKCAAGHLRTQGIAMERKVESHWYGHYEMQLAFQAVRPLSCHLAEEKAGKALTGIPTDRSQVDREFIKAKGLCDKCLNRHKNYEPCHFQKR